MLIPFICVLVGSLLPYVWDIVDDLAARAGGASANAFEGFPIFAAAVLMSAFAGVEGAFVTIACLVWVVVRFVHGLAYLADKPGLRGPMFGLGAITNLVLMGNVIRVLAG